MTRTFFGSIGEVTALSHRCALDTGNETRRQGFRTSGLGFRVSGLGFRVSGLRLRRPMGTNEL